MPLTTAELVRRYDRPGPRYTSYPTALELHEGLGAEAYRLALEEAGRDPFACYQVPQAALALKQGFGRLIRRRDDRGMVAICDGRILSRSYGRLFLSSLPPELPRTSSLEQARRWWTR